MQNRGIMTADPSSARLSREVASLDLPTPRALLFFLSHQDTYRRPLFSGKEVFCGPDTETRIAGRTLAMRTPAGVPLDCLPEDPDLEGLVDRTRGRAVLTVRGRLLANAVTARLVTGDGPTETTTDDVVVGGDPTGTISPYA